MYVGRRNPAYEYLAQSTLTLSGTLSVITEDPRAGFYLCLWLTTKLPLAAKP
jgi:hypothetical protein